MDLDTFQKLCARLVSGKITHLQFLEILEQFGQAFQPKNKASIEEKEKMMALMADIINQARHLEKEEKERLATEVESWLSSGDS